MSITEQVVEAPVEQEGTSESPSVIPMESLVPDESAPGYYPPIL